MVTLYALKPRFQALLRPVARGLVRAGVRANHVTVAALGASLGYAVALSLSGAAAWLLAGLAPFLLVRMALNALDGMMARDHGQTSRTGDVLNELGDVLSDAALILALGSLPAIGLGPAAVLALWAVLTEFAGVLAQAVGGPRRYDGPMGKSDRAAGLAGLGLIAALAPLPAGLGWVLAGAGGCLMALTMLRRLRPMPGVTA
ncbi:MAG: CDP-alcohol phosphatidyltransferase family protein [Rhodothalassiaceae bacterium]